MVGNEPGVLVVDDPNVADLYAGWLSSSYRVRVAHDAEMALDRLDDDISVVLLDPVRPDHTDEGILDAIADSDYDCQVAVVTAVESDFDIVDMPAHEYVLKPVTVEELRAVVQSLCRRSDYDRKLSELFALVAKRATLMDRKTDAELKESAAYSRLVRRIQTVSAETDEISHGLSARDTTALFHQLDKNEPKRRVVNG